MDSTASLDSLTSDFVYGSLALSPVTATATGYHEHDHTSLDELLDDYSPAGIAAQRDFYQRVQSRITAVPAASLNPEQNADREIIRVNTGLALLELDSIQSYRHNPTVYVELAGNALFSPFVLNYASKEQRFHQIIERLKRMPALFDQAKANLVDAPEVWNRVAVEENQGNLDLIDKELRAAVPDTAKAEYGAAAEKALASLRDFNVYLRDTLSKKPADWRLGKEKYARKFAYVLPVGKTPDQLLAEAEADLQTMRAEMQKLAAPKTVKQALDDIAKQHATRDAYMAFAKKTLEEATAFVRSKMLVTLPPGGNLQVIETPEFMRGIYAVAGFNPAPALQPELGAFYWVTPIPKDWPKESRVEAARV